MEEDTPEIGYDDDETATLDSIRSNSSDRGGCENQMMMKQAFFSQENSTLDEDELNAAKYSETNAVEINHTDDSRNNFREELQSRGKAAPSRQQIVSETQEFLDEMQRKSKTRLKILEESDKTSPVESEKITKGLENIYKLDQKLQELEGNSGPSSGSYSDGNSHQGNEPTRLRMERKKRQRLSKLKMSLESLDMMHAEKHSEHIMRNIVMGPNARYFKLTEEEEALVDEILLQPDLCDDESDLSSIMSSHVSTAFDVEGEEARRLAEIEAKLDPYRESHSHCSSSPIASASTPNSKMFSSGDTHSSEWNLNSRGESSAGFHHEAVSKALQPLATATTAVEDYLGELKDRREYEAKLEEIEKKLRQLQTSELPTDISEGQLHQIIDDSRKEQEAHEISLE